MPLCPDSLSHTASVYLTRPRPIAATILCEKGDDGWIVSFVPEVPGVFSQGRTKEEAREMALDALASMSMTDEPLIEEVRIHDLGRLLELLRDAGIELPPDADRVDELTLYAVPMRYDESVEGSSASRPSAVVALRRRRALGHCGFRPDSQRAAGWKECRAWARGGGSGDARRRRESGIGGADAELRRQPHR